jgi:hypothetical protein
MLHVNSASKPQQSSEHADSDVKVSYVAMCAWRSHSLAPPLPDSPALQNKQYNCQPQQPCCRAEFFGRAAAVYVLTPDPLQQTLSLCSSRVLTCGQRPPLRRHSFQASHASMQLGSRMGPQRSRSRTGFHTVTSHPRTSHRHQLASYIEPPVMYSLGYTWQQAKQAHRQCRPAGLCMQECATLCRLRTLHSAG